MFVFCSGFSDRDHDRRIYRPVNREWPLPRRCSRRHFRSCFLNWGLWIISSSLAIWWIRNLESPVHGNSLSISRARVHVHPFFYNACLVVPLLTDELVCASSNVPLFLLFSISEAVTRTSPYYYHHHASFNLQNGINDPNLGHFACFGLNSQQFIGNRFL